MADIFLCYRHDDSAGWVRALYNELKTRFGARRVFIDHDIPGGTKFPVRIMNEIQRCSIFLVVIGKDWLPSNVWDTSRLNSAEDWVRLEITAALKRRKINIIPVLVHGAAMPSRSRLPADLVPLLEWNAVHLRDDTWEESVAGLFRRIEAHLPEAKSAAKGRAAGSSTRRAAETTTTAPRAKQKPRTKQAKPPVEKKPGAAPSSPPKTRGKSAAGPSQPTPTRQTRQGGDSGKAGVKPRTQKTREQATSARKTTASSPARKRKAPAKPGGESRPRAKRAGGGKTKGRT
ncbi:MAG TPA: TIR domain-containing protein [Longimicrobium sp.]|nr:TIR domain-containing protein [Longimicrobium sp.]